MRRTLAAFLAVAVLLAAGCQDQQARDQNARLQAELEALKAQKGGGNDDLLKVLLAGQNKSDGDDSTRKLTSLGEDMRAGLDGIKKQINDNDAANNKRMNELEAQIKKVNDLQTTITSLKTMIETLETKVKGVDPNEVLNTHKDLINKEADLRVEKQQREAAEGELKLMKEQFKALQDELDLARKDITNLQGADISSHEQYKKLDTELRKLKGDLKVTTESRNAWQKKAEDLEAHLQKGSNPPPDKEPTVDPKDYNFTGTVVLARKGARADGPSFVMVKVDSGTAPPKDTELQVLDEKRNPICKLKVVQHYHMDDKESLPVVEIGCQTIDESPSNPVTKDDSVIWVKKEPKGNAGGD